MLPEKGSFLIFSQHRPSELLRGGADGRYEDSAPCRPPLRHGIFEAISLAASRGNDKKGKGRF